MDFVVKCPHCKKEELYKHRKLKNPRRYVFRCDNCKNESLILLMPNGEAINDYEIEFNVTCSNCNNKLTFSAFETERGHDKNIKCPICKEKLDVNIPERKIERSNFSFKTFIIVVIVSSFFGGILTGVLGSDCNKGLFPFGSGCELGRMIAGQKCPSGYSLCGNQCWKCPQGLTLQCQNNEAKCMSNQENVQTLACSEGSSLCNGKCYTCPEGSVFFCPSDGKPTCCPSDTYYDTNTKLCTRYTTTTQQLSPSRYYYQYCENMLPLREYNIGSEHLASVTCSAIYFSKMEGIRNLANDLATVSVSQNFQDWEGIFYAVRGIPYVNCRDTEKLQDPFTTLNTGGCCDDKSLLLLSLLMARGYNVRYALIPGEHAFVLAYCPTCRLSQSNGWLVLDPTCTNCDPGDVPDNVADRLYNWLGSSYEIKCPIPNCR